MLFEKVTQRDLAINSYIIGDAGEVAIIDPFRDVRAYEHILKGLKVKALIETHVHADFISGAQELKKAFGGEIYASKEGGSEWTPLYADHLVSDGDEIAIGSIHLKAHHTPGHTPEHLVWEAPDLLFTGDLVFVGGVGRPDLLGKDELVEELYKTLFERLQSFPDTLAIYPAHGAGSLCGKGIQGSSHSTLGQERRRQAFQKMPFEIWKKALLDRMPPAPQGFQRIKRLNVQGVTPMTVTLPPQLTQVPDNTLVIDLREPSQFASKHLPNALNMPLTPQFLNWVNMYIPQTQAIALLLPDENLLEHVTSRLRLIGIDKIIGYLTEDSIPDSATSLPLTNPKNMDPSRDYILDVRTPDEWETVHIEGSHHVDMALVPMALNHLPKDQLIHVMCNSGNRSSVTASYLRSHGFNASNVQGGIQAWIKEKG